MSKFSFGADWQRGEHLREAVRELQEGRLPGVFGLVQQVVGHWAIPKDERGVLRYSKASLDTLGSCLGYWESRKQVIDGGKDATFAWLDDNDYHEAFPGAGWSFLSFIGSVMNSAEHSKQTIRDKLKRPANSTLLKFEIAPDTYAFYVDTSGGEERGRGRGSSRPKPESEQHWGWEGPYVKDKDHDLLIEFIRNRLWESMKSSTVRLACEPGLSGDRVYISGMDDELDFISGNDVFNDVVEMAKRCDAFLKTGRCRNLLFHGPPGTGKSTLARAIARELKRRIVIVEHDAIQHMSGSAYRIIGLLRPGVLVLNDVDRGGREDNISLLASLEREHKGHPLLTCLTVNDITRLDPAILRPGRTHETREITEPGKESRRKILDYYLAKFGIRLQPEEVEDFMEKSDGFSPADTREFCETALAVGSTLALGEIERIKNQRELYAGDACADYNEGRSRAKLHYKRGRVR